MTALAGIALAQSAVQTEPRYRGGFDPRACRYPKEARAASLSGCCRMNLEIDAEGRVLKIDGVCSDPVFLEPDKALFVIPGVCSGHAWRQGGPGGAPHGIRMARHLADAGESLQTTPDELTNPESG